MHNENCLEAKEEKFYDFLLHLLDEEDCHFLDEISQKTDIYVFSGVIRDYFLKRPNVRDLDLVLEKEIDWTPFVEHLRSVPIRKNSFGGYKIKLKGLNIDAWYINRTWGIQKEKLEVSPKSLINTAFFNFSAIVYSIKKRKFYYDNNFVNFYYNHIIDLVYEKNPNIGLCIVNSLYYKERLGFRLSPILKQWIANQYSPNYKFDEIQKKHFGKVFYKKKQIRDFYMQCH